MSVQKNSDLPASWKIPGVYIKQDFQGSGAALDDDSKRVLIMGYRLSTGTSPASTPEPFNAQSDVDTAHGRGSQVARAFAAFQSHIGAGLAEPWVLGIDPPSGGTAATFTTTIAGTATSAGSIDMWVAGYRASIGVASGDTPTVIAAALDAELDQILDAPATFGASSGTLTSTMVHKGIDGNDLPIMIRKTGAATVTISPGIVTFSGWAGAGTCTLAVGATTITSTVETSNDVSATNLATAINAGNYPVTASANAAVVTLYYRNDRVVRRITASATGATATLTLHGTTGALAPTVTTAITNIEGLKKGFSAIVTPWTDSATLDSIYDSIVVQENGLNQKGPMVFLASAGSLTTAGAIVTAPEPDLTASPRFWLSWCREAAVQAYEIAARCAAVYVESDYWPQNLAGMALRTRGGVPLLNPHLQDVPSDADINSALRTYYLTPVSPDSRDNLVIVRPRTTSNASNQDLHEPSIIRQSDRFRHDLRQRLTDNFSGKNYRNSTPKTPNTITTSSVKDCVYVFCREKDDQDLFDDAEAFKDAISVEVDSIVNTRFNVYVPHAVIRSLYQLGVVQSPQ